MCGAGFLILGYQKSSPGPTHTETVACLQPRKEIIRTTTELGRGMRRATISVYPQHEEPAAFPDPAELVDPHIRATAL